MAEQAGPIGWNFDPAGDQAETKETEDQAREFGAAHADVIGPLMDRIHELKRLGVADDLYMMCALLITAGNNLLAYIKSAEIGKAEANSADDSAES